MYRPPHELVFSSGQMMESFGSCTHVRSLDTNIFRQRTWDYFRTNSQNSNIRLCCQTCGADAELWVCLNCCRVYCMADEEQHALQHRHQSRGCSLLMTCRDSHILCCRCECYLYPRELSGSVTHEDALAPAVEAWLQVLGRSRNWWRVLDGSAGIGQHGLKNYGNTCFFTSTVQSLMHTRPLLDALVKEKGNEEGKAIQRELRLLQARYWSHAIPDKDAVTFDPKRLWGAVVEHAVFGEYAERTMEDANTLLLDILNALDEPTTQALFGVSVTSQTRCSVCAVKRSESTRSIRLALPKVPLRICQNMAEFIVGAPCTTTELETVISLPLVEEDLGLPPAGGCTKWQLQDLMACARCGDGDVEISDLLRAYLAPAEISDFRCDGCGTMGKVFKRSSLVTASDIIVFNLKRFATVFGRMRFKVHKRVKVPMELDLATILSDSSLAKYQLTSLVVHDGGMGGGHYMSYVRERHEDKLTENWIWFSDDYFGNVDAAEVWESEPFLVFYERTHR